MHVGGLQVFIPPQGAGPEFVRDTYKAMLAWGDIQPTSRKRPATAFGGFINVAWTFDDDIDFEYHVRRSALPAPGRVLELLELTSRPHGTLLDRHRPLWEAHVIESPNDGRFAVYTKVHHALVDGVSAQADAAVIEYRPRRQRDSTCSRSARTTASFWANAQRSNTSGSTLAQRIARAAHHARTDGHVDNLSFRGVLLNRPRCPSSRTHWIRKLRRWLWPRVPLYPKKAVSTRAPPPRV